MMLGVNLENTTSSDFRITATARYLAFDTVGSGSELRVDGTVGSDPSLAIELYRPIGRTPLFVAPYAGAGAQTFNLIDNDAVIARYRQTAARIGLNAGVNLGARSDVRIGAYCGRTTASITVGDPGFPELRGKDTGAELTWRLDTQDSPVIPSGGWLSQARLSRVFNGPDIAIGEETFDIDSSLTQLSAITNRFWSVGPSNRVFVYGGVGTSFDDAPLPTDQFTLGTPFRLGAYGAGQLRGPHYYIATAGYFRRVGRLPDFMGGPVFAGSWLENGDAFEEWELAGVKTNGGIGIVMDTIVGPVVLAGSVGLRRTLAHLPRRRPYVSVKPGLVIDEGHRSNARGERLVMPLADGRPRALRGATGGDRRELTASNAPGQAGPVAPGSASARVARNDSRLRTRTGTRSAGAAACSAHTTIASPASLTQPRASVAMFGHPGASHRNSLSSSSRPSAPIKPVRIVTRGMADLLPPAVSKVAPSGDFGDRTDFADSSSADSRLRSIRRFRSQSSADFAEVIIYLTHVSP